MTPPRIDRLLEPLLGRYRPDWVLFYPSPSSTWTPSLPKASHITQPPPSPLFTLRLAPRVKTWFKAVLPAATQTRLRALLIERQVRRHGSTWVLDATAQRRLVLFRAILKPCLGHDPRLGARPVLLTHANRFGSVLTETDRQQLIALRRF